MLAVGGPFAIDAVAAMEARGIKVELDTLKEAQALNPEYIIMVVNYMSSAKSTIAGRKRH